LPQLAIDANLILRSNALADVRRLPIDADTAGNDPFFELAPRTVAGICQRLVQFGRIDEDRFVAAFRVGRQSRAAANARSIALRPRRPLRRPEGASLARWIARRPVPALAR